LDRFQFRQIDEIKSSAIGNLRPDGLIDLLGRKTTLNQSIYDPQECAR
jgi:hypothetical protein